jgi:hypothetical protein
VKMRQPYAALVEKNKIGRWLQEQSSCGSYLLVPSFLGIVDAKDRAPIQ